MGVLREGERTINLPASPAPTIDLAASQQAIFCASGCLAVEIEPPRTNQGEVLIPETVGARLRADAGTVVARGQHVHVEPGERVLLRPYHGLWIEPFSSVEPAISVSDDGGFRARGRFVAIRVNALEKWTDLHLPDVWDRPTVSTGRVVSRGSEAWPVVGSRVVFSGFHRRTAHQGLDRIAEDTVVVEDRQVLATLGPSPYRAGMVRFYGSVTDWRKSVLMVWRMGEWRPIAPWVLIERDLTASGGLALPEAVAARTRNRAVVISWGAGAKDRAVGETRVPQEILLDPHSRHAIDFDLGDMPKARQLVHESSIWAVIS